MSTASRNTDITLESRNSKSTNTNILNLFGLLAVVLPVLLYVSTAFIDINLDDAFQRGVLAEQVPWKEPGHWSLRLFTFLDGDPERTQLVIETFGLPWWTLSELKVSFLRPVSSLTSWMDFQLWPDNLFLTHLHSLFWYGLVLTTLLCFYRMVLPAHGWIAVSAVLLYGLDFSHLLPVGWIANRNALVTIVFGVLTLCFHHKWRTTDRASFLWLSCVAFVVDLLAGEAAIATCAYLFAYSVFLDPKGRRSGIYNIIPYAILAVTWYLIYKSMGFGTFGSGGYADPGQSPGKFLSQFIFKFPALLYIQWTGLTFFLYPPELSALPDSLKFHALVFIPIMAWMSWPVLKSSPAARFFALGSILAAVPACSGFTYDRMLVYVGVGAIPLMVLVVHFWFSTIAKEDYSRIRRWSVLFVCGIIMFIQLVINPFAVASVGYKHYLQRADSMKRLASSFDHIKDLETRQLIVINPKDPGLLAQVVMERNYMGKPVSPQNYGFATGMAELTISRIDEYTVQVKSPNGFTPSTGSQMVWAISFRDPAFSLVEGQTFQLEGLTITVDALNSVGVVSQATFRFPLPLESKKYVWLQWLWDGRSRYGHFEPYQVPAIGQSNLLLSEAQLMQQAHSR